ncbi:MAG: tRNA (adenosine(37)-N6)-dimethylallyltransferase MiaA, partial [Rickettsiales bacterium]|nr:tRNA (adenosine(37)-N6)-dimethylallyltransferase MiaA [Rickettsiales bacterium]
MQNKAVIICGTTASSKSDFAIDYAKKNNGEIINIDSLQVYEELPVITASPSKEDKKQIPHHLFNFIKGDTSFSVAKYLEYARCAADEISSRGKLPIFVGGTGFYINAILNGINELPQTDVSIREKINGMSLDEIIKELQKNTPDIFQTINENDRQR